MEKVWVTGGTGFFGSHIVRRLSNRAIVTTRSDLDLLDKSAVLEFVRIGDFKQIVHAAGLVGGLQFMKRQPERMYDENFRMGENVIDAAAQRDGMHVVLIGTALCYPKNSPVPTPETALYQGELHPDTAAYAQAKLDLLDLVRKKRNLTSSYLIHTNLFGPGNHLEPERSNVIASLFLRAIEAKQEEHAALAVWGTGDETRDFLYVEDAARAVELALNEKPEDEVLNIGSGKETAISALANMVCNVVGFEGNLEFVPSKGGGAARRCLDTSRAKKILGFNCSTSLEIGLNRTFEWIKSRIALS